MIEWNRTHPINLNERDTCVIWYKDNYHFGVWNNCEGEWVVYDEDLQDVRYVKFGEVTKWILMPE